MSLISWRHPAASVRAKVEWATQLNAEVGKQTAALSKAVDQLHKTEKDLEERTAWALGLQKDLAASEDAAAALRGQVGLFQTSRWVRFGRKVGLGPAFPAE